MKSSLKLKQTQNSNSEEGSSKRSLRDHESYFTSVKTLRMKSDFSFRIKRNS